MASVSTYLNFDGQTEAAFEAYKALFGTEYLGPIVRMGEAPTGPDQPALTEEEKAMVMNVALPILGGHVLMGTDILRSRGHDFTVGTNTYICLHPDARAEADRLFAGLSEGGKVEMPMTDMFWGDYWGCCTDRFGVQWMINCSAKA